MREIRENARSVNPQIMVIPEIYPGIEREATVVGADVYEMYNVIDAIAHEYEFGNGEHMAASRTQLDWFLYQAGMLSFRAFAQGKSTWILNYSWDGNKGVDAREAMKNLAMSEVIAGANFWDAPGHVMAGSNDPPTRKQIFAWIAKNEKALYLPRKPMNPVGVYFSPKSRDYAVDTFLPSYRGALVALLQAHREVQVVTPRTHSGFRGECLVLPNVSVLGDAEKQGLKAYRERGGNLVILDPDAAGLAAGPKSIHLPGDPASRYLAALERDFSAASANPPTVAANFALVGGKPHVFLANFGGLIPNKVVVPAAAEKIRVKTKTAKGDVLTFVPFLGEAQLVHGERNGDDMEFVLPPVERGAVIWIGTNN
jgi:hypothetical protein